MILDSSAILSIALGEADARRFAEAIADAPRPRISTATWLEASMVVDRKGDDVARQRMEDLWRETRVEIAPFTEQHARRARDAWRVYGKGNGHGGTLNFGDCMAYGFAMTEGDELLFKGNDFPRTDVRPALKA